MYRRPTAALGFALSAFLLLALAMPGAAAPRPEMVRLKGKITTTAKDEIRIAGKTDADIAVFVGRGSRVSVEGTAVPEYLTPGVNVQFVADVNNAGVIPSPLSEITICTFTDTDQPTFSLDDPTKPSHKGKDALNKYLVRGTIKQNKNGTLTVTVPGKPNILPNGRTAAAAPAKTIKATLAPDAKIKVLVSEISWAQVGDEASVQGIEAFPGEVRARTLKITMAKPLEPKADESPTRKRTAKR